MEWKLHHLLHNYNNHRATRDRKQQNNVIPAYGLDGPRISIYFPIKVRNLPYSKASRPALLPTTPSIQWILRALSLGDLDIKMPTHLHLPARLRKTGAISTFPYSFMTFTRAILHANNCVSCIKQRWWWWIQVRECLLQISLKSSVFLFAIWKLQFACCDGRGM
jgi:hypothetical protein